MASESRWPRLAPPAAPTPPPSSPSSSTPKRLRLGSGLRLRSWANRPRGSVWREGPGAFTEGQPRGGLTVPPPADVNGTCVTRPAVEMQLCAPPPSLARGFCARTAAPSWAACPGLETRVQVSVPGPVVAGRKVWAPVLVSGSGPVPVVRAPLALPRPPPVFTPSPPASGLGAPGPPPRRDTVAPGESHAKIGAQVGLASRVRRAEARPAVARPTPPRAPRPRRLRRPTRDPGTRAAPTASGRWARRWGRG